MPTSSTVPQVQPVVRPDLQMSAPTTALATPVTLVPESRSSAPFQSVTMDLRSKSGLIASMTEMSVPTLPRSSTFVAVSMPVTGELPGPPNCENPKVPKGAPIPANWFGAVCSMMLTLVMSPSCSQCPAEIAASPPSALKPLKPIEHSATAVPVVRAP